MGVPGNAAPNPRTSATPTVNAQAAITGYTGPPQRHRRKTTNSAAVNLGAIQTVSPVLITCSDEKTEQVSDPRRLLRASGDRQPAVPVVEVTSVDSTDRRQNKMDSKVNSGGDAGGQRSTRNNASGPSTCLATTENQQRPLR
jgi:hypothetical protein